MAKEKFLVGVYDDLRQEGDAYKIYMGDANYLGTFYTEPEFDLYSLSRKYPGLVKDGSTSILLEVFEVNDITLFGMDYYEGCSEFDPYMNIYNRIEIDSPWGPCFIYEYNRVIINKPRIDSGDWFRFKREVKKKFNKISQN